MSHYVRHVINAQAAFDYATNTQALYERHLEIARSKQVHARLWVGHIETAIMPAYAKEMREPTACISSAEAGKLVVMLDHYYYSQIIDGA